VKTAVGFAGNDGNLSALAFCMLDDRITLGLGYICGIERRNDMTWCFSLGMSIHTQMQRP